MDLPVEKWKVYVNQKWASLDSSLKEKLCQPMSLKDSFSLSLSLFQSEDEEYLFNLSRYYCMTKNATTALSCKEEGNRRFRKKEYRTAAVLYSRALSHAKGGSPEMAVCYANRSAALFHLGQFEACLEDIQRAEEKGYPDRLWPKIMLRKAECLLSLGKPHKVAEALATLEDKMSASESLEAAGSDWDLLRKLQQLKIDACNPENSSLKSLPATPGRAQASLVAWNESSQISCASSSVSLAFSMSKGRHLVAIKDILPGEILVKEEAFVSVLRPGEGLLVQGSIEAALDGQVATQDLHCHHCLKALLASIPCQGCSYARYCSPECAQLAWKSYHSQECSLGGLLLSLGVFCHVALRAVLVAGLSEVSHQVKSWQAEGRMGSLTNAPTHGMVTEQDSSTIPGCNVEGRYTSSYQTVSYLLPHAEKHSPEFRFLCSLSVAGLCKTFRVPCLEETFSGEEAERKPTEVCAGPQVLGEAMLRHVLQLQCNAQAVTALTMSGSEEGLVTGSAQVCLATALFPVISLLNHSCDPNTSMTFSGRIAEVRASRLIFRGQEILHCYGPHRCRMEASERRKQLLSQYFFECQCLSCTEELNPSSQGDVSAQHSLFRCPSCHMQMQGKGMLQCSSGTCKTSVPEENFQFQLKDLQQLTQRALVLLRRGEPGQSLELLQKCQAEAQRFLSPAHLLIGEIEDHMAQAYVTLGKWCEAAEHLRCSLWVVEANYGPSSIEVGQELFKLAQVLFNGYAVLEALDSIVKTEAILSIHLGSQSAQAQELQEMKACLEDLLRSGHPESSPSQV